MVTLNEFVQMHRAEFPDLANFEGFLDEAMSDVDFMSQADDEQSNKLYEDHLNFDELVLGVKEGKFFQGRFNVSRLVASEATVKVSGLN